MVVYEHLCSLLPVMRVSCLAAHQWQKTSLLMHSFSFRCERGNFFGEFPCLAYFCYISPGLSLGGWGALKRVGMFSTGRACVQDLF